MKEGQPQKESAPSFPAENFPALRSFLRGYFHQDMKDEYGSPEEAVREFCQDADSDEQHRGDREERAVRERRREHRPVVGEEALAGANDD